MLVRSVVPHLRFFLESGAGGLADLLRQWYGVSALSPEAGCAAFAGNGVSFLRGASDALNDAASRFPNLQTVVLSAIVFLFVFFLLLRIRRFWCSVKYCFALIPAGFIWMGRLFSLGFYKNGVAAFSGWWGLLSYRMLKRLALSGGGYPGRPDFGGRFLIRMLKRISVRLNGLEKRIRRFLRRRGGRGVSRSRIVSSLTDEGRQEDVQTPVPAAVSAFLEGALEPAIPDRWSNLAARVVGRWRDGLVSGLLVEGGSGSGKSLFLSWFSGQYGSSTTKQFSGEGIFSIPFIRTLESAAAAGRKITRRVVIVDDAEELFRREIGGFDPFRRFCTLIEKTRTSILWVVSVNPVFSAFIRKVIPLAGIFPFSMSSPFYSVEEIMGSIDDGFRNLGCGMRVLMDRKTADEIGKMVRRKTLSPAEVPDYLKRRFFQLCYENGRDNMRFHFYYLRRSLRTFDGRLAGFSLPVFFELPGEILGDPDALYLLHSLYLHRALSAGELSEILCFPLLKTEMILSLLYEHTLLKKEGARYSVFPVIYHQLLVYLESKNVGGVSR